jgi:hypothetical protein
MPALAQVHTLFRLHPIFPLSALPVIHNL